MIQPYPSRARVVPGRVALRRVILLMAILLGLPAARSARGQSYPIVVVSVSVAPPYSPYLADWERSPERVQVTLRNTDPSRGYDLRLSGFAENLDGSIRVETKDDYPGARRVTIGAVLSRLLIASTPAQERLIDDITGIVLNGVVARD